MADLASVEALQDRVLTPFAWKVLIDEDCDFDFGRSALEYVLPYLAGTELEQAGAWFTVVWIDRPPPTL